MLPKYQRKTGLVDATKSQAYLSLAQARAWRPVLILMPDNLPEKTALDVKNKQTFRIGGLHSRQVYNALIHK